MADWGMKLSQEGYDVKTTATSNLIFTTGARTVRVFATGTAVVTIPAAANVGDTIVQLPYFNSASELGNTTTDYGPTVIFTAVVGGKRFLSNMSYVTNTTGGVTTSLNDFHYLFAEDLRSTGFASAHVLEIGRTASASTAGTTETFSVRWFVVGQL